MKAIRKENLPTKVCPVCNRPFAWRKKWEKIWAEVRYCSDKCRRNKPKGSFPENIIPATPPPNPPR